MTHVELARMIINCNKIENIKCMRRDIVLSIEVKTQREEKN